MMLDIYDLENSSNIILQNQNLNKIGELIFGTLTKSHNVIDNNDIYEFSGSITLNETLTEGSRYYLLGSGGSGGGGTQLYSSRMFLKELCLL